MEDLLFYFASIVSFMVAVEHRSYQLVVIGDMDSARQRQRAGSETLFSDPLLASTFTYPAFSSLLSLLY